MDSVQQLTIPSGLLVIAGLSPAFVAQFALFTAIILLWTIVVGKLLKSLCSLPVIAGRIIAGIALGPSLINIASFSTFSQPMALHDHVTGQLYTLATVDVMLFVILLISSALTVSYLLWIAGHETDLRDIVSVGGVAVGAGIFGALLPIVVIAAFLYYGLGGAWGAMQSIGMGLIFAATSVSIPVAMLFSYNKMHLKSSKAALGAAVVDDIFAVILLSFFSLSVQAGFFGPIGTMALQGHGSSIGNALFLMVCAFVIMGAVGYWIIRPLCRWLVKSQFSHLMPSVAHVFMLVYFAFSELIGGLAGITGAYFAGLFHRMGDSKHSAEKVITPFVNAFLLPLFLGSIGLQLDMKLLDLYDWLLVAALLFLAIISKLLGCWLATAFNTHWSLLDTYLFGSSMVARGEVGLVVTTILFGSSIITAHHYVIAVVVIVLTTIATPVMLAYGFKHIALIEAHNVYTLNIGTFPLIGMRHMFTVINSRLKASGLYSTIIKTDKGRETIRIGEHNVTIILSPDEGILFQGNKKKIDEIVQLLKEGILSDLERFEG